MENRLWNMGCGSLLLNEYLFIMVVDLFFFFETASNVALAGL